MPIVLLLQGILAAAVMALLRQAASPADLALSRRTAVTVAAVADAAVRADERDQQRKLHDTVLATLTMVGTGAIAHDSPVLRVRAASDLAILDDLRAHPEHGTDPGPRSTRLDLALAAIRTALHPGLPHLDIRLDAPPIELPRHVTAAITDSAAEALTNVARHADTSAVLIRARPGENGVTVEVSDHGRGFDPTLIPRHRRGYRESIAGRMAAIGGTAHIESHRGVGTLVVLAWPGRDD